jgi:RHS repeat-associated protein
MITACALMTAPQSSTTNDLYQTDSTSGLPTKYVQLNGRDIAVITGPTGSGTVDYSFPDSQHSTNVVTDSTSNVTQNLDYFPYGAPRINSGSDVSQRKYIGKFADASGLDYFNARYFASDRGQFISQDPLFVGDPKQQNLIDPQSLNYYSYSDDNPITKERHDDEFPRSKRSMVCKIEPSRP